MLNGLATSRCLTLRLLLAVCLPLCCCRVGVLAAMVVGGTDGAGPMAVATCPSGESCCRSEAAAAEATAPGEALPPPPCDRSCCIKDFMPPAAPAMLPGAAPAPAPPTVLASPGVRRPAPARAPRQDWRACRSESLLRLRCALIV